MNQAPLLRSFDPLKTPKPAIAQGLDAGLVRVYPRLEIEIGCGVGLHPIKRAALSQESLYVAIEHTRERYGKFERRLENLRAKDPGAIPNLIPIHANAISWISHHIEPASVDHYWIMYPNPYPKKKHLNQRWYAMPFTSHLVTTLKPGGRLTLVTNMKYYADEAEVAFTQQYGLKLEERKELTLGFDPRTHFEKKYLERGEVCFELSWSN
ncbi:MAG: hypothetical protein KA715_08760 [Xanthomonadaceae bacterium]|nr:hypothetical protein [Xanthomonadaceae bacterium]